MAQVQRHRRAIATALLGLVALALAPALAQDRDAKDGTDLYDRPVLAIDPGMHTAKIWTQAVDAGGRFAVTGSADRTVRIWSVADGKLLRTIWIPVGPQNAGAIFAVAISPDGSTVAAGGWTEGRKPPFPIYIFDRESGNLIARIHDDLPNVAVFLTLSPDGRYLAATLGSTGLRVFDRNKDWSEAFRDDQYGDQSDGAAFSRDGRLATTSYDGLIRLYQYDLDTDHPNFRRVGNPVRAPSGNQPFGLAFGSHDKRLAVGYSDVAAVDILDSETLNRVSGHTPAEAEPDPDGFTRVAWSADGQTLFATGAVVDAEGRFLLFAWNKGGEGDERRMTYCVADTASGVEALTGGPTLVVSQRCLGLMDDRGKPIWTVPSPILDFREQTDVMRMSEDGKVVDFGYRDSAGAVLRFDVKSLTLSSPPPNDGLTFPPNRQGLTIDGGQDQTSPTLGGRALPFTKYDIARSLAIAQDAKRFFLGSMYALAAFDDTGAQKWRWQSRNEVGGERQQGWAHRRLGRRRRRDPLASHRRRARASGLAGPSEQRK
jgi:WD40 repeat protein